MKQRKSGGKRRRQGLVCRDPVVRQSLHGAPARLDGAGVARRRIEDIRVQHLDWVDLHYKNLSQYALYRSVKKQPDFIAKTHLKMLNLVS